MVIRKIVKHLSLMILLAAVGCESVDNQATIAPAASTAIQATPAPTLTVAPLPTRALRDVPATLEPAATRAQPPAASTQIPVASVELTVNIPPPTANRLQPTAYSLAPFTFGTSVEGRELHGYRIGEGPQILMLIGAVHGGFETNTSTLIEQLAAYFRDHPGDLLPDVSLILIPTLNPDGVARGRVLEGRFNANAVDLKRNWGCGWEPVDYFASCRRGETPFSYGDRGAVCSI